MIKITGGELKNRKLETISNFVRPTSSLKREAFFSIIESYAFRNSLNLLASQTAQVVKWGACEGGIFLKSGIFLGILMKFEVTEIRGI